MYAKMVHLVRLLAVAGQWVEAADQTLAAKPIQLEILEVLQEAILAEHEPARAILVDHPLGYDQITLVVTHERQVLAQVVQDLPRLQTLELEPGPATQEVPHLE